jgi:hypothetical protein
MMDLFKPTEAEIKSAFNGNKPEFKDNEEVVFIIEGMKENMGQERDALVVECKVLSGENSSKNHSFWVRSSNPVQKQLWFSMCECFWTREQMIQSGINRSEMIGKQFKAVCKKKPYNGKIYDNWARLSPVSNTPNIGTTPPPIPSNTASDVPF